MMNPFRPASGGHSPVLIGCEGMLDEFQQVGGALVRLPENVHIVSSGSGRCLAVAPETKPERL